MSFVWSTALVRPERSGRSPGSNRPTRGTWVSSHDEVPRVVLDLLVAGLPA